MALLEGYERRIDGINEVCKKYDIPSIEAAADICKEKGFIPLLSGHKMQEMGVLYDCVPIYPRSHPGLLHEIEMVYFSSDHWFLGSLGYYSLDFNFRHKI